MGFFCRAHSNEIENHFVAWDDVIVDGVARVAGFGISSFYCLVPSLRSWYHTILQRLCPPQWNANVCLSVSWNLEVGEFERYPLVLDKWSVLPCMCIPESARGHRKHTHSLMPRSFLWRSPRRWQWLACDTMGHRARGSAHYACL